MTVERWLRHARRWVPAVVLLVVCLGLLFTYRLVVTVTVSSKAEALETARADLAEVEAEAARLEAAADTAETTAGAITSLRDETFGTPAGRLTAMMLRVKDLARDAGLRGQETIAYPQDEVEEQGLIRKSFEFSVSGGYGELRRFVNLLEVDEAFLTLEEIRVTEEAGTGQLTIRILLSTLFVDPAAEART